MIKKFKSLVIASVLMCIALIPTAVKAAQTTHDLSLVFYNCNALDDDTATVCVDNNGNPIELTPLSENAMVPAGGLIRMDVHYKPSTVTPTWMMQFSVLYNSNQLSPLLNGSDPYVLDLLTTNDGGIYPPKGTLGNAKHQTNYEIVGNDVTGKSKVKFIVQDTKTAGDSGLLTTEGTLLTMFFEVKSNATAGEALDFTFKPEDAVTENGGQFSLNNRSLMVFKTLDTDASLKGITVKNNGTNYLTNFNANTKTYNVYVPNAVSSVEVLGDPNKTTTVLTYSPSATNNTYSLDVSTTKTITISTVAEDGQHTDTYTVKVYRLSNVNTLNSLSLSGINFGTFASGTTTYTVANPVPYATTSTTITATPTSNKATLNPTSGTTKSLSVGSNAITVVVTPECAKSTYSSVPNNTGTACQTKTYTVNVTRTSPSTNNYLSSLTVDGTSVPSFVKTNSGPYSLTVGYDTTKVNIAGTAEDTQLYLVK